MEFEKVSRIMRTLPIGYYLGHKIDVRLDPGQNSYYDPMHYCIVVGFKMLPLDGLSETDPHAEEIVRGVLYHEISHAILTPKNMRVTDIINVFEDQRIETLLKAFYMNVDFQKNVRLINNHMMPEAPASPMQFFYDIVRYGEGPADLVKEVYEIIKKHAALNAATQDWETIHNYIEDVNEFWRKVRDVFNAAMSGNQNGPASNNSSASNNEGTKNGTETNETPASHESETHESETHEGTPDGTPEGTHDGEGKNEDESEGSASTDGEDTEDTGSEDSASTEDETTDQKTKSNGPASLSNRIPPENLETIINELNADTRETLKAAIDSVFHQYEGTELAGKISRLVEASIKKRGRTAGATPAYSGKLDPKLIHRAGRPENYKWWEKENPQGQFARFVGLRINLFCDVSGSFTGSQKKLNEIIKALSMIERRLPNFTLNVVKCGQTTEIAGKNEREIVCGGGNALGREIFDIYKRLQDPTAMTYNLVVFDGESQYYLKRLDEHKRAWAAFNHPNCYIISDTDNEDRIKRLCKKANATIVSSDYAELFEEKVMTALKQMLR